MILSLCPNPSVDKFLSLPALHPGQVNRSRGEESFPGGKGTHVALAIRELGGVCRLAGFWGGPTGQWVREECEKAGIDCIGPQTAGWTRTCLTIRTEGGGDETEILEQGPTVTEREILEFYAAVERGLAGADALSVSGSWPSGTPDGVYIHLKRLADEAGIPFWADASGGRLREVLETSPFGVHINREEAESCFGKGFSPEKYARKLLDHCSLAAVTAGADGLWLGTRSKVVHARCSVGTVISTIGCGDCLFAGLIHSWLCQQDPVEAALTGTACGAANCLRPELGMFHKKDVDQLRERVEITITDVS